MLSNIVDERRWLFLLCSILSISSQALFAEEATNSNAVIEYLEKAEGALAVDHLTTPPGDNAVAYIEQALTVAPGNPRAIHLLERVNKRYGEMVTNSLKRGEQAWRLSLQRAKTFRDRASEVTARHGLSHAELQSMDQSIARHSQFPVDETVATIRAQDVSSLLVKKLFDQHILLSELALDRRDLQEAEWHVMQASGLADRYALASLRLRPLKQEIMSSRRGMEMNKPVEESYLARRDNATLGLIRNLVTHHVRLGESAFEQGNVMLARRHRDIAEEFASQYGINDNNLRRLAAHFADKGSAQSSLRKFRVWGTF